MKTHSGSGSVLFFLFFQLCFISIAQNRIDDSLLNLIRTGRHDTLKLLALNKLGWKVMNQNVDSALKMGAMQEKIIQHLQIPDLRKKYFVSQYYNDLGVYLWIKGEYAASLKNHEKALQIREEAGNRKGVSISLSNMALVYRNQGYLPKALDANLKALKIVEEMHDSVAIARQYTNIGAVFKEMLNFDKALEYEEKALVMAQHQGNHVVLMNCYKSIGHIYLYRARQDSNPESRLASQLKSISYYEKSLAEAELLKSDVWIVNCLGDIGITYGEMGKREKDKTKRTALLNKGLDYETKALSLSEHTGNQSAIITCLGNIGSIYNYMGQYQQALPYLKRAIEMAEKIDFLEAKAEFYGNISSTYYLMKDYRNSIEYLQKQITARDSLLSEDTRRKQTRLVMQYEFDKKQTADSIANAEILAREALQHHQEIKQQRIYTFSGIAGFALMLVIAIVALGAYRQKQKSNQIISHQKMLVEEKQKEILDSIRYVRRIQQSLLPSEKYIGKTIGNPRWNKS